MKRKKTARILVYWCWGLTPASPLPQPSKTAPPDAASPPSGETAAQAGELKPFRLGHLNSTAHLLAFVAREEGFFAEEGLDAELTQFILH